MAVYQIETDQGTFEVETEEPKTLAETATSKLKENIVPFLPISPSKLLSEGIPNSSAKDVPNSFASGVVAIFLVAFKIGKNGTIFSLSLEVAVSARVLGASVSTSKVP